MPKAFREKRTAQSDRQNSQSGHEGGGECHEPCVFGLVYILQHFLPKVGYAGKSMSIGTQTCPPIGMQK
ncbi:hypothetical protein SAMN05444149_105419 [Pseudosulfitobacter pseudonitzschiae]|uniref:hypothetical protein n=1 Tax=Pseudosulfitobacter pseudonitzschiae TaxID=1402135 RepID=UPI000915F94D|nr:hypothetical protein [Pseudosulfitobacter pseudonitzschiae]QKS08558.1 hypothetical protein HT745_08760 [Pseudosulfitobacter pseudonitzschiae]SHF78386.1 hypothetical protein SAMN05444149_105419 [Pseudosulfitobacter pseudonitzschiae]